MTRLKMYETAIKAALHGGKEILEVYRSMDFMVEYKNDESPLTVADKRAHLAIIKELEKTEIPVLSEEGSTIPYEVRKDWEKLWIVDPLDGTKEFIKRNGDFTVNIALVEHSRPVFGVVYVPVTGHMYVGVKGLGAVRISNAADQMHSTFDKILTEGVSLPEKSQNRPYTVVASLSHMSPDTKDFIDTLRPEHPDLVLFSRGSSLKLCAVAEGSADIYPRLGPTMEWDTAAGQAVVEAMGGSVLKTDNTPLTYNREDLLNPYFIVRG